MATVTPIIAHFAEGHRLDVSEIQLDAGTFAPVFTGILLDWRCPHGVPALGHLHRHEWRWTETRVAALHALWHSLQEACRECAGGPLPVVGEVVGREEPAGA